METVILPRKIRPPRLRDPAPRRFLKTVAVVVAAAAALGLVAGFAGRWAWPFEIASHFQVQYFWALAAAGGVLAWLRKYRLAVLPALLGTVALARIVPFYVPDGTAEPVGDAARLRILSFNVYTANREHRYVCEYVRQKHPAIAVFYEVNANWGRQLEQLEDDFPYHKTWIDPEIATRGLAVYSRFPLWDVQLEDIGDGNRAIIAEMLLDSRPVTLIAAHTTSPKSPSRLQQRNRQLARLAELSGARSEPVVLVGDLNSSPWSPTFEDFLHTAGLRHSRLGSGVQATWPSAFCPFGIPIDHCLISNEFLVKRCRAGTDVYSDHLPLIVDLVLLDDDQWPGAAAEEPGPLGDGLAPGSAEKKNTNQTNYANEKTTWLWVGEEDRG
jgi:endonuclease/exonuclease/phosphatase (EEP) superfamily protein YafD